MIVTLFDESCYAVFGLLQQTPRFVALRPQYATFSRNRHPCSIQKVWPPSNKALPTRYEATVYALVALTCLPGELPSTRASIRGIDFPWPDKTSDFLRSQGAFANKDGRWFAPIAAALRALYPASASPSAKQLYEYFRETYGGVKAWQGSSFTGQRAKALADDVQLGSRQQVPGWRTMLRDHQTVEALQHARLEH